MKRFSILLVAVALAVFGLAACGDDDDEGDETASVETTTTEDTTAAGGGGAGGTLDISSPESGDTVYDQASLSSPAGTVTVNYDNPSQVPHDVVIEGEDGTELGKTELVSGGQTSTTVELQPGTYTYYCDVPGHREGGMEGSLTVK
jgi:plastocyanin